MPQPKKGRGKKRPRCLQRKKSVENMMVRSSRCGDGPGQSTGEGPVPPHNRRGSHQAVALPWGQRPLLGALNPSCGPDPSRSALSSVRRPACSRDLAVGGLTAQMERTRLAICWKRQASEAQMHPLPPVPSPEAPEGLAGFGLPAALLSDILTKGPGLSQAPQV